MTKHWLTATLLSSALVAGCSGSGTDTNAPQPEPAAAPAPAAPAPEQPAAPAPATPAPAPRPAPAPARPLTPRSTASSSASSAPAPAPAAPAAPAEPPRPAYREVTVPSGAPLALELITAVSSENAQVEDQVRARLKQAVVVDGTTVIPAGAVLHGNVTAVERSGRVKGRSHLALRFTEAEINGQRNRMRSAELSFEGAADTKGDVTKIGGGAGIGAVIGGIVGGASGAAKGAAIGGAAGTGAVLATRGKEVELASGMELNTTLSAELNVRVPTR
jgi:hypothetical protein